MDLEKVHIQKNQETFSFSTLLLLIPAIVFIVVVMFYFFNQSLVTGNQELTATTPTQTVLGTEVKLDK